MNKTEKPTQKDYSIVKYTQHPGHNIGMTRMNTSLNKYVKSKPYFK